MTYRAVALYTIEQIEGKKLSSRNYFDKQKAKGEINKKMQNTTLNDLAKQIHENAVAHGWWDEERPFGEIIALCHSELSEALEEDRAGRPMAYYDIENREEHVRVINIDDSGSQKMEGIATEMIDCIIRILDWAGHECIDVDRLIKAKMRYNESRPYKHGKRY